MVANATYQELQSYAIYMLFLLCSLFGVSLQLQLQHTRPMSLTVCCSRHLQAADSCWRASSRPGIQGHGGSVLWTTTLKDASDMLITVALGLLHGTLPA